MEPDSRGSGAVTLLIIAGGTSRRMGREKLLLPVPPLGLPLVRYVAEGLLPLASKALIVANSLEVKEALQGIGEAGSLDEGGSSPSRRDVTCLSDDEPGCGPLGGLATGLRRSDGWTLTVAGDMPFVCTGVARFLIGLTDCRSDAVVPFVNGQPQPLLALYHRRCLSGVEQALASGHRSMDSFWADRRVRQVSPEMLRPHDPELISFTNVNTPADWKKAYSLLSQS